MKYQLNFGRLTDAMETPANPGRFRLAVMADLSGRASRGDVRVGDSLANQRALRVDIDNFDQILAAAHLRLTLDLGASSEEISIASIDDFHPDELFGKLNVFGELSGLRQRLGNARTFEQAAREVQAWPSSDSPIKRPPRSGSDSVPRGKLSDFRQLMQRATPSKPPSVEDLIKQIVAPYIVARPGPGQEDLIDAVDLSLSAAMRRVLHHPDFQAAESIWRSIDLLVRRLETGPSLDIVLYDVTAEEIAADLAAHRDLTQSGLYQLLVAKPALQGEQDAISAVVANYMFEPTPPHADLLARLAQIGAAGRMPFIAGLSIKSLEHHLENPHPLSEEIWESLRGLPETTYLALVSPRHLLRWPYGKKTEPIDPFPFEEFVAQEGLQGMLWGNGAMLMGLLLAQTFMKNEKLSQMNLGEFQIVGDLPFHYYTDDLGDVVALPCGERLVSDEKAMRISSLGCVPLLSPRGGTEVKLGGFRSVHGTPLAGPWAVVELPRPDHTSAGRAEEPEEPEDDDQDLEDNNDELDEILTSLDDADDDSDSDDNEVDPELSRLLEDL